MNDLIRSNLHLPVIKTARDVASINAALDAGFNIVLKKLVPKPEIRQKFAIVQEKVSGHIRVIYNEREFQNSDGSTNEDMELVLPWTDYYHYHFATPYAAYLVPPGIAEGQQVILEDLIEDIIGARTSLGNAYRLQSAKAVWTGSGFDIQFDELRDFKRIVV